MKAAFGFRAVFLAADFLAAGFFVADFLLAVAVFFFAVLAIYSPLEKTLAASR
jgi:hypothetical protein